MARVDFDENVFIVGVEHWESSRAKMAPHKTHHPKTKTWELPLNSSNCRYIRNTFANNEITAEAKSAIVALEEANSKKVLEKFPPWYKFNAPPMMHQTSVLNKAYGLDEYGLFHDMGTGKTFTAINLGCAFAMANQINAILVFCPTPVKLVWLRELALWSTIPVNIFMLKSGGNKKAEQFIQESPDNGLKVMIVGIEAMSQGKANELAMEFVVKHKTMAIVDESSRIKNFQATRTERIAEIGSFAKKRLIMTGTPITQGMHDLYAQMAFLNWEIIGMRSYYSFRNRYCVMGGFESRSIIGYNHVPELLDLISPYVDVVTKKDTLDLKPKVFEQRHVELTKQQKTALLDLKVQMFTESEGEILEVNTVLERLTRYQQIIGGNFPFKEEKKYTTKPIPGQNPKMNELVEVIGETGGKVIIWARFVPEIKAIVAFLHKKYGPDSVAEFHGGLNDDEKIESNRSFVDDEHVRFMVSNQQVGGMGQTWIVANVVIYYSNSFSYEDRVQSEDRAHRKGQENKVTYIDLIMNHEADKMIHKALVKKEDMAKYVESELKGRNSG